MLWPQTCVPQLVPWGGMQRWHQSPAKETRVPASTVVPGDHSRLLREKRVYVCVGGSIEGTGTLCAHGLYRLWSVKPPWMVLGAHLASARTPQVHAGAQPHAEHIEGGPVHQVEVEVVLKLGRIQHLERNLGDLARGLPW